MRFATYIFDANSHQGPPRTVFLHFARPVPSEMKITKIRWTRVLGRPGGMRGGAGGDMRGSEICKFEICVMDFCFRFDTPCLGFRPRAADSIAPRIPPGLARSHGKWTNDPGFIQSSIKNALEMHSRWKMQRKSNKIPSKIYQTSTEKHWKSNILVPNPLKIHCSPK